MSRPLRMPRTAKMPAQRAPRNGETRVSLNDLIWMLQPVPVGTPHSLPALGAPNPWYILPAVFSPMPAPWDRAPNKETVRLEQTHQEAAKAVRVIEQARKDAQEPRDPAAVKAEQNRKKKERKLRAKARKEAEAEAGGAEDKAEGGESEGAEGEEGAAKKKEGEEAERPAPTVAYALPAYLDDSMQEEFLAHYARMHAEIEERRQEEAVLLPKKFQQVDPGDTYLYPREHPEDPQRGVTWDTKSMTLLYHTE